MDGIRSNIFIKPAITKTVGTTEFNLKTGMMAVLKYV